MAQHNDIGKVGESLALNHIKSIGYSVLEQNWRHKNLEIDLIAKDENVLLVIEVKTRTSDYAGDPEVFVDSSKQKKLIRAINEYVSQKDIDLEIRFDIVSVLLVKSKPIINHIKGAFYPKIAKI